MRIALFGCGRIAQTHAKLLNALTSDAQLIFCDRNLDRAEKYSAQFSSKAPAYSDLAIMLEAESPTAVHILTHPESHFGTATIALEAGAHTYIEKPVTESLDELLSLQELAASRQRILYAGYSTLGYPVVQRAKRLIESGKMGDLVSMHSTFNFAPPTGQIPYGNPEHWAYSLDGGILQNVIDHPLSLLADALDDATVRHVRVLRRADLPQRSPNLMHVSAGNDRQIGSFTLSYANGNASAAVSYYLEAGTIDVDLRSFTLTTQYGSGPQSLVKRARTGVSAATAIGVGTAGMVLPRLIGRGSIDRGISGLISNFYSVIEGQAEPLVDDATARTIVGQLEGIWTGVEFHDPGST